MKTKKEDVHEQKIDKNTCRSHVPNVHGTGHDFLATAVPKAFYTLIQLHLLQKRLKEQKIKTSLPRNLKKQQKIWEK
ncbi:MAG: hypothetical protein ACLTUL_14230 [Blautia faecis]